MNDSIPESIPGYVESITGQIDEVAKKHMFVQLAKYLYPGKDCHMITVHEVYHVVSETLNAD